MDFAIVIQAGGEGRRLQKYSRNIPKSLVSVNGKTLLNHNLDILSSYFPAASIYIISDHLQNVLNDYYQVYPHVSNPILVEPTGKGTSSGLVDIFNRRNHTKLLFLWCDLFLDEIDIERLSINLDSDVIGLSKTFGCRWSIDAENKLVESFSKTKGIAGLFFFNDTSKLLQNIPSSGEFVKWLSLQPDYNPKPFFFEKTLEIGDVKSYEDTFLGDSSRARFFNKICFDGGLVTKECVDSDYDSLLNNEIFWYQYASSKGYQYSPGLYSINPLTIDNINGQHPDEIDHPNEQIIDSIIASLAALHGLEKREWDIDQIKSVYIDKTLARIKQVSRLLPLHFNRVSINGEYYQNPFHEDNIEQTISFCQNIIDLTNVDFCPIHGDPTFSNTIYCAESNKAFLIDPRGIFGSTKIFGDPYYDYAKLLYSVDGCYDEFNKRNFELIKYSDGEYWLTLPRSRFADFSHKVYSKVQSPLRLNLIHALIWFSLCGYVKDHLDSITGAYLKGILVLQACQKDFLRLSNLPKTWFLDVDGTIVEHNTQFSGETIEFLPNVEDFLVKLGNNDSIVLTSARKFDNIEFIANYIEKISPAKVVKVIEEIGVGERILVNDEKPSGLKTAYSLNVKRNNGFDIPFFMLDERL